MMLARKIANAGELCWDSFDSQERLIVLYLGCVVGFYLFSAVRRRSHERLIRELRDELDGAAASGRG